MEKPNFRVLTSTTPKKINILLFKKRLVDNDLYSKAESLMYESNDPFTQLLRIEWEHAISIEENSELVNYLKTRLKLSKNVIDSLFAN